MKQGKWTPLPEVKTLADAHRHFAASLERPAAEHQLDALVDGVWSRMKKRKVDPLSPGTVTAYELACKRLKHLLRKFARPDQVKQKDAAMVKVLLADTPVLANRVMSFGRQIWSDFLEHQLIEQNPFVGVKRHKTTARTRLYTWAEWHAIEAKAGPVLRLVMDGIYLTDQRIRDVLKIDEVDLLEEGIYVKQMKGGKELIIAWNDDLRAWVAACRAAHGAVVTVDFGKRARPLLRNRGRAIPYHTIAAQWRKACALAGVEDGHMHDGRAFSATETKRQHGEKAAQDLLGHTDMSTTRIYLRGREVEVVRGPAMRRRA